MTKTTVHMIGQAHLDPAWLWRWTEGRAEALATSRSAADRLAEYPDFHFVRGEAQIYEWIEREDPALFAEIVERIREGRWHVVNGMVVQPDMCLPQGESFVRHFLLGKATMRQRLGVEPAVAYCVDSFGHAETLPQIFRKCGCDAYVFMRPGQGEMPGIPQAFRWQAPDGSRVLAFRIIGTYGARATDLAGHIGRTLEAKPAGLADTMCFFGVGNHGGGPTIAQIEALHALQAERDDIEIRFSSPQAYFDAVRSSESALPAVAGELYYHATGCYSANSALKRAHRQAECHLLVAERMVVLAQAWTGRAAEPEALRRLWHDVCFNQFHDILGGCTVKEAADDAIAAFQRVIATAQEITDDAGRAVASRVDTRGPGGSVVLFNPSAEPVERYVEYEPWTDWDDWTAGGWGLADERGEAVAWQKITSHEAVTSPEGRGIHRLVFRAALPPLGYRLYRFAKGLPKPEVPSMVRATPMSLENEHLRVALDPETGVIRSCVDIATGLDLAGPGGWNVLQVLQDDSDTWSHGKTHWDTVAGSFGRPKTAVAENGPLQAALLVERSYEEAGADGARGTLLQELILRRDEPELLIRNWLCWQGRWRMLKLACDVAVSQPRAVRDVAVRLVGVAGRWHRTRRSDVAGRDGECRRRSGAERGPGPAERWQVRVRCERQHAAPDGSALSALRLSLAAARVRHKAALRLARPGQPGVHGGFATPCGRLAGCRGRAPGARAQPAAARDHGAQPCGDAAPDGLAGSPDLVRDGADRVEAGGGWRRVHRSSSRSPWTRLARCARLGK